MQKAGKSVTQRCVTLPIPSLVSTHRQPPLSNLADVVSTNVLIFESQQHI